MNKLIANAVLYNIGWYACVAGGNTTAVIAAAIILTIHFVWISNNRNEWILIIAITLLGVTIDSLWFYLEILQNPDLSPYIPLWLIMLWAIFSTTLNHCLKWFKSRQWAAGLSGFIIGPAIYFLGTKISDVELADPIYYPLIMLALSWGLIFPTLFIIVNKLERQYVRRTGS